MPLTGRSPGSVLPDRGEQQGCRNLTASETGQHARAGACYNQSGDRSADRRGDPRAMIGAAPPVVARSVMAPTNPLSPSVSALSARSASPAKSEGCTSDNIESGTAANRTFDAVDLTSLRLAYKEGRDIASLEVRTLRVSGRLSREKLVAGAHTADLLARAFVPINPAKAAQWRGVADGYAERAELAIDFRELAGCVDSCPDCTPAEPVTAAFGPCRTCGGVGLAYSPGKLAQLGKGARHA